MLSRIKDLIYKYYLFCFKSLVGLKALLPNWPQYLPYFLVNILECWYLIPINNLWLDYTLDSTKELFDSGPIEHQNIPRQCRIFGTKTSFQGEFNEDVSTAWLIRGEPQAAVDMRLFVGYFLEGYPDSGQASSSSHTRRNLPIEAQRMRLVAPIKNLPARLTAIIRITIVPMYCDHIKVFLC